MIKILGLNPLYVLQPVRRPPVPGCGCGHPPLSTVSLTGQPHQPAPGTATPPRCTRACDPASGTYGAWNANENMRAISAVTVSSAGARPAPALERNCCNGPRSQVDLAHKRSARDHTRTRGRLWALAHCVHTQHHSDYIYITHPHTLQYGYAHGLAAIAPLLASSTATSPTTVPQLAPAARHARGARWAGCRASRRPGAETWHSRRRRPPMSQGRTSPRAPPQPRAPLGGRSARSTSRPAPSPRPSPSRRRAWSSRSARSGSGTRRTPGTRCGRVADASAGVPWTRRGRRRCEQSGGGGVDRLDMAGSKRVRLWGGRAGAGRGRLRRVSQKSVSEVRLAPPRRHREDSLRVAARAAEQAEHDGAEPPLVSLARRQGGEARVGRQQPLARRLERGRLRGAVQLGWHPLHRHRLVCRARRAALPPPVHLRD